MRTNGIVQLAPGIRILMAFALGIWMGDELSAHMPIVAWAAIGSMATAFALATKRMPVCCSSCILMAVMAVGGMAISVNERLAAVQLPNGDVECRSVVGSRIVESQKSIKCDLLTTQINGKTLEKPLKLRAVIMKDTATNNWREIEIGGGIRHWSTIKQPGNFGANPNFDYRQWMKCHGYKAQTFIPYYSWHPDSVDTNNISRIDRLRISLQMRVDRFVLSHLKDICFMDESLNQDAAIVAAMTLGNKVDITKETSESFSISGASHILALSGLHLGIIYCLITILFGRHRKRNLMVQSITIGTIWIYVVITGMPVSIVRAATMLTLYAATELAFHNKISLNALACTAIIMLFCNPQLLWDVSFQLSFMAVGSILALCQNISNLYNPRTKLGKWGWASVSISIAAQIGTAPLVAFYFGRFSCYFIIVNIVVIPLATLIMISSLTALLATIIHPSFSIMFWCPLKLASIMSHFVTWTSNLPYASIENIHLRPSLVMAYYIAMVIIAFAINRRKFR